MTPTPKRRQEDKAPTGPSAGVILQMVQDNDDKHEAAHARLRGDMAQLEATMERIRAGLEKDVNDLTVAQAAGPDVTSLKFTTRTVIAVIIALGSLVGAQIARDASRDEKIKAASAEQSQALRTDLLKAFSDYSKSQDARYQELKEGMLKFEREQTLQRIKTQETWDMVVKMQSRLR